MNALSFSLDWTHRLGWVLAHFLWQGVLIGSATWLTLAFLRKASSQARYLALCGALAACIIVPVLTWFCSGDNLGYHLNSTMPLEVRPAQVLSPIGSDSSRPVQNSASSQNLSVPQAQSTHGVGSEDIYQIIGPKLPVLVMVWVVGVTVLVLRLIYSWVLLQRLCALGTPVIEQRWIDRLRILSVQIGISRVVVLLECVQIEIPTVVGWLRPVLLVPATFFSSLPPDQIEAIFLHELAHIRRHDFFVNLIQLVVETLLFYHPAVWWINWCIRQERENCCDDAALQMIQNKLTYVSALAALEESRSLTMGMSISGGSLFQRVRRIVGVKDRGNFGWPFWLLIIAALVVGVFLKEQFIFKTPSWSRAFQIPENDRTTTLATAPVVYRGQLYLFLVGEDDHRHYLKTFNGEKWSEWHEVPASGLNGTTLHSDAAAVYQDKLYLFAVGGEDHQHYLNVFNGTTWSGWNLIPGFGTTLLADSAVTYNGRLYLFAIGGGDHQHYVTSFDGTNWNCWSLLPGFGTTPMPDATVVYKDRLYLFAIGGGVHHHYVMSFDGTNWNGWSEVPDGGTTAFPSSPVVYRDKLYLFAVGGNENYVESFDGTKWNGWDRVPDSADTIAPNSVVVFQDELHLFSVGEADHKVHQNIFGPGFSPAEGSALPLTTTNASSQPQLTNLIANPDSTQSTMTNQTVSPDLPAGFSR